MEAGFLNFHDEEHFSDFSLSMEQNLMDKPQDLLMHIVENDFDYMETHLDVTSSDSLWENDQEHNEDIEMLPDSEVESLVPKMDTIKEDFAKVLTDWHEHIGYLQASDMEEYLDIIGINMNTSDRKSFSECISSDETAIDGSRVLNKNVNNVKEYASKEIDYSLGQCTLKLEQEQTHSASAIEENNFADGNPAQGSDVKTLSKDVVKQCRDKSDSKRAHKSKISESSNSADLSLQRQKKTKNSQPQLKPETENEDCIDVETVSDELPVLEAGDVKSLLEQFEASENSAMGTSSNEKTNKESNQNSQTASSKSQPSVNQHGIPFPKKFLQQASNLHKNIRDSLPKEVIDRIKASGRKRVISVIPPLPNGQGANRSNGTRMQEAAMTLSRNKLLKIVANNVNTRRVDGGLVQLDHDYCSSGSATISSSDSNSEYERPLSDSEKSTPIKRNKLHSADFYATFTQQSGDQSGEPRNSTKSGECWTDANSKKDSGLESGEVSDASEEQTNIAINGTKENAKETTSERAEWNQQCSYSKVESTTNPNDSPIKPAPVYEMKIRSALATSILQLRKGVLTKTKPIKTAGRMKQMVSVLKKPLIAPQATNSNPAESIITTIDSSNDQVRNIIVPNTQEMPVEAEDKKPPRRKLNLAEYRSRREQNRSDNSRTNSPIQPMTLIYVHHASTTTEPIKDDPENLIWSEREIVSVLKPKVDIDDDKVKPKPQSCDVAIQTYETVFEFPTKKCLVDIDERNLEQSGKQTKEKKQRTYRKRRITTSSSRSRSRSRSNSRNRSRSRSRSRSRNRSRSRSQRRSTTRRRKISHRRSSVSSSSSWSSRSRSHTRSTSRSRSRYSRSFSRSSRSRSRSSSRYSSCSRSSSHSNFGRSKWSSHRRKGSRERRRSYDRNRRRSSGSCRGNRAWRRSPSNSYRKQYDTWYDREKQRQVEERRVIYVGRLNEGITKADLRRRFEVFGPVVDISVHFREHGDSRTSRDNYGFVTFAYKNDAYEAVEHGNDDPSLPRYDLCFGGRRAFCKVKYADLDGMASNSPIGSNGLPPMNEDNTFDLLLKEAKAKLRKRKV